MQAPNSSLCGISCAALLTLAASDGRLAAQEAPKTLVVLPPLVAGSSEADVVEGMATTACCDSVPNLCEPRRSLTLKVIPYLWVTEMDGDLTIRNETAPVFVSMGEMWDLFTHDLNMAFLGQVEAKFGRVGLLANGVYMDLSPGGQVRRLQFNSDFTQSIIDLAMTYDVLGGGQSANCGRSAQFELLAGARYNSLNGVITLTGPRGNTVTDGGAEDWTDLIVGARTNVPLGERWSLLARADVGGFGISGSSQITWNVEAAAEYQCSERSSMFAGYRALWIDYTNGDFGYDMRIDGPMAGFVFKF